MKSIRGLFLLFDFLLFKLVSSFSCFSFCCFHEIKQQKRFQSNRMKRLYALRIPTSKEAYIFFVLNKTKKKKNKKNGMLPRPRLFIYLFIFSLKVKM